MGYKVNLNKKYLVVLIHPNTLDYEKNFKLVSSTFNAIKSINIQTIWIWPNIDAGSDLISRFLRSRREEEPELKLNFYKNFEPEDYLKLINSSECLIGNTSSGIRECSYLGIPFVNIGDRQDQRERGKNVIETKIDDKSIFINIRKGLKKEKY